MTFRHFPFASPDPKPLALLDAMDNKDKPFTTWQDHDDIHSVTSSLDGREHQ